MRWALWLPVLWISTTVVPAAAQPRAAVALELDGCEGVSTAAVSRIVGIELHVTITDRAGPDITVVRVSCTDSTMRIRVDDPVTGTSTERAYDVSRTDRRALSRTVALASVEMVASSWSELRREVATEPDIADSAVPIAATASAQTREAAREAVRARDPGAPPRWTLLAFALVRGVVGEPSWGAGARIAHALLDWLEVSLDAAFTQARVARSLGSVRVDSLDASVGAWGVARWPPLAMRVGLGARVGGAWLVGETDRPDAVVASAQSGVWIGPWLGAGLALEPVEGFVIAIDAEAGLVAHGVRARVEGEDEVRMASGDVWIGGALGVGAHF